MNYKLRMKELDPVSSTGRLKELDPVSSTGRRLKIKQAFLKGSLIANGNEDSLRQERRSKEK